MAENKVRIEDHEGNIYYPHTKSEVVHMSDGTTVEQHAGNKNNPHGVTKSQVGLGSVENYGVATQAEAEAGTVNNKYMTPQRAKQAFNKNITPFSDSLNQVKTDLTTHLDEIKELITFTKSVDQSIASNNTQVFWDAQSKTIDFVMLEGNRVKILEAGTYEFAIVLRFASNASGHRYLNLADTLFDNKNAVASGDTYMSVSISKKCIANELINIRVTQTSGVALDLLAQSTLLQVRKVG